MEAAKHKPHSNVQATMARTAVFLQKACLQHRYIRSRDNSNIVERPERLRAVNIGLAAAIARLEEHLPSPPPASGDTPAQGSTKQEEDAEELTKALGKLQLSAASPTDSLLVLLYRSSTASRPLIS